MIVTPNDDDIVYGEIDEDKYDGMEGGLEEVVVTPDDDREISDYSDEDNSGNDDWWRTDSGDEDNYVKDDDSSADGADTSVGSFHPDNNQTTIQSPFSAERHKPVESEKLFKQNLPAVYPHQTCHFNCLTTTVALCYALNIGDFDFKSYYGYLGYIENMFYDTFNHMICEEEIYPYEINRFLSEVCDLNYEYITKDDIVSCIANGDLVMATIANGTHEVVIVGYYNDYYVDAYQCVNPGNGLYETHYESEFNDNMIIKYSKEN